MTPHEGPALDTAGEYTVIDCQQCEFAHVVPLPDAATLRAFYQERYYEQEKPHYFKDAEEDAGWWDLVYHERLAMLEGWVARREDQPLTVLDVGSGPGGFLVAARKRGWDTWGIEPSPAAWEYSRANYGLVVHNGEFDDYAVTYVGDNYSAINFGEVLEHVPDPAAWLRRAHSLLSPGGLLLVIVPNDYSVLQGAVERQVRTRWWLAPPAHLNYFNIRSLHALVRRCGFAVADVTSTFPLELFILMGLNYAGNATVGREIHGMRKRLELALELSGLGDAKRELYRAFARRGIGRDIVMLARRQ